MNKTKHLFTYLTLKWVQQFLFMMRKRKKLYWKKVESILMDVKYILSYAIYNTILVFFY